MNRWITSLRQGGQDGSAVVIAMVFTMVFLIVGLSLYLLLGSQNRSIDLERTEVKSFNVAEAGIDAGMLTLKLAWPRSETTAIDMDAQSALLKTAIQTGTEGMLDPTRSDASEFIQVLVYDNIDENGDTTTVPYPDAPAWDSNRDDRMFVDARSNVNDDRHRILIMCERDAWGLGFDTYAIVSNTVDSNGQGLGVVLEDGTSPIWADVNSALHKGVDYGTGVEPAVTDVDFDTLIDEALLVKLQEIAINGGTYFDDSRPLTDPLYTADADGKASTLLSGGSAGGKVVWVKSASAVEIAGNNTMGSKDNPVVVVIDTPDGSENGWTQKGSTDFYGVLIVLGNTMLKGTPQLHGSLYCNGVLTNKGNAADEINYSQTVINNINDQYTVAVRLVPNSWEEYTIADSD